MNTPSSSMNQQSQQVQNVQSQNRPNDTEEGDRGAENDVNLYPPDEAGMDTGGLNGTMRGGGQGQTQSQAQWNQAQQNQGAFQRVPLQKRLVMRALVLEGLTWVRTQSKVFIFHVDVCCAKSNRYITIVDIRRRFDKSMRKRRNRRGINTVRTILC
jgi:hypothetical protein